MSVEQRVWSALGLSLNASQKDFTSESESQRGLKMGGGGVPFGECEN